MTVRATNNPLMLIWARDEIGLSITQASEAIGVSEEALKKAENGEHRLTLKQLKSASKAYQFPLGYFYLSKPPNEIKYKPIPDCRVAPNYTGVNHYRINLEIKKCRDRREVYLDLAESIGLEIEKFKTLRNPSRPNIGIFIRKRLDIKEEEISKLKYDKIYSYWKNKLEEDGVLVYETQYIPEFTGVIGVSIFYEKCPVILIRRGGQNSTRKLFTLLHEYAHLLLGESGINDEESLTTLPSKTTGDDIEYRCNQLAANILAPEELVPINELQGKDPVEMMEFLSQKLKITFSTAAVCLRKANLISKSELGHLLDLRKKEHNKNKGTTKNDVKIPREVINRIDLGKPFFDLALSAYTEGKLDVYDTSKLLNLRVNKIDKLLGTV